MQETSKMIMKVNSRACCRCDFTTLICCFFNAVLCEIRHAFLSYEQQHYSNSSWVRTHFSGIFKSLLFATMVINETLFCGMKQTLPCCTMDQEVSSLSHDAKSHDFTHPVCSIGMQARSCALVSAVVNRGS